ncbi:DUF4406 domain-containing protein [Niameybacter massiliensis]|uniref:DUF4406 domain-containing protein n=1 Tax=Holtiella tumoricola TaxID=3018743 RepID=A0AA42DJD2_9FIRM|nr:DUF4406 domain-containing protein [Holtiella tumoricola]MDA3730042.1 DUF4406 domain-containing protein [Holtiella tumoricola]
MERNVAIEQAKVVMGEDVEVLETFFDDFGPCAKPLQYLARSLDYLATADVAYFVEGWDKARGCKIEYLCAEEYGIKIIEE